MMKVSVFMFCLNGAKTIRRAIESVLDQNYENLEFIVQDGGSTDGTLDVLREYGERIRLQSRPDRCPAEGFSRAISRCTGELIGSCLSDEELVPGAVATAVEAFAENPELSAITRDAILTDIEGNEMRTAVGRTFTLKEYLEQSYIPHFSASFFSREALARSGFFSGETNWESIEFDLWIGILREGTIGYVSGAASKYTIHDNQLSRQPSNALALMKGRISSLERLYEKDKALFGGKVHYRYCIHSIIRKTGSHLLDLGDRNVFLEWVEFAREKLELERNPEGLKQWAAHTFFRLCEGRFLNGDYEECLSLCGLGILAFPDVPEFLRMKCVSSLAMGRLADANALLRTTGEGGGDEGSIGLMYHEIALFYERRGEIDKAISYWDKANAVDNPDVHSLALVARLKSPSQNLQSLYDAHEAWARRFARADAQLNGQANLPIERSGERRIGFSCSFWTAPTISFQLLPWLKYFTSTEYRVYAYINYNDGFAGAEGIDVVRDTAKLNDDEFAEQIQRDQIDILIELNGHSPGNRFRSMAMRCAPIQVSYLNYTATSGVENVDYLIADDVSCPLGEEVYYKERVLRLPGCFFCFDYRSDPLAPPPSPVPSIGSGHVTFCSFSSAGKLNQEVIELYSKLLDTCPNSRILVRNRELDLEVNRHFLTDRFKRFGIPESRIEVRPGLDRKALLREYGRVDIALDTFPYNGGNTIAEALWQGVPVVSLKGDRFSAAYGASLLSASGCSNLIAESKESFLEIACGLAADEELRRQLRCELRKMMVENGFSDSKRFASKFKRALDEMIEAYPARI